MKGLFSKTSKSTAETKRVAFRKANKSHEKNSAWAWVCFVLRKITDFAKLIPGFLSRHKKAVIWTGAAVILIGVTAIGALVTNVPQQIVDTGKKIFALDVEHRNTLADNDYDHSTKNAPEVNVTSFPGEGVVIPEFGSSVSVKPTTAPDVAVRGEHSEAIPEVQQRLMELWYMDQDEPTDYFGSITENAIKAFQRRNDIEVTGLLTYDTYAKLMSAEAKVYMTVLNDEGSDVEFIQTRLYELGYLKDYQKGFFDESTYNAVIDFQRENSLDVDGKVGKNTKEALYSPDAVGKSFKFGDSGDEILQYQNRLQTLGYLTTEPDGVYGKDTQMAVKRFQELNSLISDGNLGPSTRELLMSDNAKGNALSYGMNGSDVLNIQRRLYELNYLKAKDINSYFTALTEKAVKLFQKNNSLSQDGTVGRRTMSALFSESAVPAKNPVTDGGSGGGNNGGGNGGNTGGGGNNGGGNGGGGDVGGDAAAKIENFIKIAMTKVGCKYVRGGKGPNVFDCSGFVYWCLNRAGVSQGYMTSHMWANTTRYQRNNNINKVKRGDVIVYQGHVGIALGNWTMIDASQSKGKVVVRSFSSNYWHKVFICSFRIFR